MRAGLRFRTILLAGGLFLSPLPALAQEATQPATTNTPATDAVGPRELQDFSLPGTTTRPAEQPAPAPATSAPAAQAETASRAPANAPPVPPRRAQPRREEASAALQAPTTQAPAIATDKPEPLAQPTPAPATQAAFSPPETLPVAPAGIVESENKLNLLPWLLAALALVGGALFLFWRRRPREAFAGGPQVELFQAPESAPRKAPRPAPRSEDPAPEPLPAPQPQPQPRPSSGIVSSRLRPSVEIGVQPTRCLIADDQVVIEFEIELFNSGTAPARAVLAEASLFNAGADQEQVLQAFFADPVGKGDRLDIIPPLRHATFASRVAAPRDAIQEYELGGHRSFVPVIAFNALYEWSGGKGQTSAAYLVGRNTGGEKLGPLRLDSGSRELGGLGALPLPGALKT